MERKELDDSVFFFCMVVVTVQVDVITKSNFQRDRELDDSEIS